jgi:hypothetical protein
MQLSSDLQWEYHDIGFTAKESSRVSRAGHQAFEQPGFGDTREVLGAHALRK